MSDMDTIMKNLKKGKQVESNLAMFANSMMTNASRLAQIRFTLNFPVLYESMLEDAALDCSRSPAAGDNGNIPSGLETRRRTLFWRRNGGRGAEN